MERDLLSRRELLKATALGAGLILTDRLILSSPSLAQSLEACAPEKEFPFLPGEVIEHGNRDVPELMISVDDGWYPEVMLEILDIARDYAVPLTLFPAGENVDANPEIYARAYQEGHRIENHSRTHPENIHLLSEEEMEFEILSQLESVRLAIGDPNYQQLMFRSPYSSGVPIPLEGSDADQRLKTVCERLGLSIASTLNISPAWMLDPSDGSKKAIRQVQDSVLGGDFGNGSIVTLHDLPADLESLPTFIVRARRNDLNLITMNQITR